ncbi:DnaJ domain-containing protein, partial [Winogradskyella sp.]|nr:DnaJ domain-containing protein [Winogradskyella sp.]
MKKYYDTLGLKKGASQEDVQAAYDKLSSELDPSKNNNEAFFVEEYKKVQEAYAALSNSSILATDKGARTRHNNNPILDLPQKSISNTPETSPFRKTKSKIAIVLIPTVLFVVGMIAYQLFKPDKFLKKDTIVVDGVTKNKFNLRPITGIIKGYGTYKEGLKEGHHDKWNEKAVKIAEGEYASGLKIGYWQYYYDDGQLKKEENYKNGLKDGLFKFWSTKGILIAERNYTADTLVGINKSWSKKGLLQQVADYDSDFTQTFDNNGKNTYEGSFIQIANSWTSKQYRNTRSSLSLAP